MTKSTKSRAALAAILAAVVLAPGAAAQAGDGNTYDCEGGVERLEAEFREIEAKHGWDKAAKWWDKAWQRYYESCVI